MTSNSSDDRLERIERTLENVKRAVSGETISVIPATHVMVHRDRYERLLQIAKEAKKLDLTLAIRLQHLLKDLE